MTASPTRTSRGVSRRVVALLKINKYTMAKKLYVGNLPYSTTDSTLKDMFSEVGTVESAVIIMDKFSGRSKGFGFVEMSSDEEAQKGIETFNGKEVEGRALTVNEAKPMEKREPRSGGDRGGRGFGGGGGGRGNW